MNLEVFTYSGISTQVPPTCLYFLRMPHLSKVDPLKFSPDAKSNDAIFSSGGNKFSNAVLEVGRQMDYFCFCFC